MDFKFSDKTSNILIEHGLVKKCDECYCPSRDCPYCRGSGFVPTEHGQAILKFVEYYCGTDEEDVRLRANVWLTDFWEKR